MKIKIRKSTPADIPFARKYLTEMWVMHARMEPSLMDAKVMGRIFSPARYRKRLKDKNYRILIAEADGERAAISVLHIEKIDSFFKNNRILFLDGSIVVKKFRRHGIRNALLLEAERYARKRGIRRIQARVYTFNTPMQKLLKSAGYRSPHATWDKVLK